MEYYVNFVIVGYGLIVICLILEWILTKKISLIDKMLSKKPWSYLSIITLYVLFGIIASFCIYGLLRKKNFRMFAIILSYMMLMAGLLAFIGILLKLLGYNVKSIKYGYGLSPVQGVPVAGWLDYGLPVISSK